MAVHQDPSKHKYVKLFNVLLDEILHEGLANPDCEEEYLLSAMEFS